MMKIYRLSILVILCLFVTFGFCAKGKVFYELVSFESDHFAGSGNCAVCHSALKDAVGLDVSIDSHWRSTMMANAARDPLWQAKVASEVKRHPAFKFIIEEKCSHCHTPMAERQSFFDTGQIENTILLDDGFLNSDNKYHAMGMDGVSCSVCHQIQNADNLGTEESFSGHFTIDSETKKPKRIIYGPYANVFEEMMVSKVGYIPLNSDHVQSSALCATCHVLYTPALDDNGNVVGKLAEQAIYLEWQHSIYGDGLGENDLSCQQCHMPKAVGDVLISNRPKGQRLDKKSPFFQHHFVGGNAYMVNLIKEHKDEIKATSTNNQFDATVNRTIAELQSHTAKLSFGEVTHSDDTLMIPLTVSLLSGHKLPTGFPSKRAWIHVRVTDKAGLLLFESGAVTAEGKIEHDNANADPLAFEPHYDLIDSAQKVQIYESIMEDVNNLPTYILLRGANYIKDNRLLPLGFDKDTAHHDIGVFGAALTDENFIGGSDQITYKVNVATITSPLTIEASLKYQIISYPFYIDLIKDNTEPLVKRFQDFYESTAKYKRGIIIDSISTIYNN